MMEHLVFSFIGMFVAMDIVGTLPLYLGMTQGIGATRRMRVLRHSILVAAAVAFAFVALGTGIFKILGITLSDFKMGGGIVLLVMAILDLVKPRSEAHHTASTGVVPLAVPLITGPALITTVMLQVPLYGHLIVLLGLTANFSFAYLALSKSNLITRVIGKEGADIASKIAALFMTAIAVAMIRSGLLEAAKF